MLRRYKTDILCILLLVGLIIAFFWRLFYPVPQFIVTPDFGRSDAWSFSISSKYILQRALHNNTIPLWSKDLDGGGFPILGEGQVGTFFLPNLFFFRFFDFVTAYNLALMFSLIVCVVGMYWWLRIQKISSPISFLISLCFGFSGVTIPHLTHIALLQGFSLFPIMMAITYLWAKTESPLWMYVYICIGSQQFLSGFPQASFITLCVTSTEFIWQLWITHKLSVSKVIHLGIASIGIVIASAVQFIPSQEFLQQTANPNGFLPKEATQFSFPIENLKTLLSPFFLGTPQNGSYLNNAKTIYGNIFWENNVFIGFLPLLGLAVAYILRWTHAIHKRIQFLCIVLIAAILFMAGSHSPIYFIFSLWPFNLFRVPSRFVWIFVPVALLIASHSLDNLRTRFYKTKYYMYIYVCLATLQLVQFFILWNTYHVIEPARSWLTQPSLTIHLRPDDRVLSLFNKTVYIQDFITKGWSNPLLYFAHQQSLPANGNIIWNIETMDVASGRELKRTKSYNQLFNNQISFDETFHVASISGIGTKLLAIAGVTSIITPLAISNESYIFLATKSAATITNTLYRPPLSMPRAYIATNIYIMHTVQDAADAFALASFTAGNSALLESSISIKPSSIVPKISILKRIDTETIIHVRDNSSPQILILTDTYYPGWHAYIDNKETHIYPANIRHRAIIVPSGNHVIRFLYIPTHFREACLISIAMYIFILAKIFQMIFLRSHTYETVRQRALYHRNNHGT